MNTDNLLILANVASQQPYMPINNDFVFTLLPVEKTKDWHNKAHYELRQGICREIFEVLKSRRPYAPDNWCLKLPTFCQRLECGIYENANSLDEYSCSSTLKIRLQNFAKEFGRKMDITK